MDLPRPRPSLGVVSSKDGGDGNCEGFSGGRQEGGVSHSFIIFIIMSQTAALDKEEQGAVYLRENPKLSQYVHGERSRAALAEGEVAGVSLKLKGEEVQKQYPHITHLCLAAINTC